MIYRAIIGGGRPFYSHCLFFEANARDYQQRMKVICDALFESARTYHIYSAKSEAELMRQALDPQAFVGARWLAGTVDGYAVRRSYLVERDCLVVLTHDDE